MTDPPLLSLILFSPLVAALVVLALPGEPVRIPRWAAFLLSLVPFALSLVMLQRFDPDVGTLQLVESVPWIPSLGVRYGLGVDGFSLWLVVLATFLTPLIILEAWSDVETRVRPYLALTLLLEFSMLGALLATDLLLFFFFWEFMLIPMVFIIGVWGGAQRRYAAIKFMLYTLAGSAFMLVGIIWLVLRHAQQTGTPSFDITTLYGTELGDAEQFWLFAAFALSFMIKVPMVPFHTWLPDAHTEAPTGGSVNLAGVLLKMGGYGFLRFAIPMFPVAAQNAFPVIVALALIGILYGALVAYPQPDMKRLVAYSSVSHLGFVMLGLYAFNLAGITGGVLQMVNHGLSTGALFFLVGLIYHRRHTREISRYGGLWGIVPMFSVLFLVVTLSSIGLPGTNGFVGEFLILSGAFRAHPLAGALATIGVVLGALYMLTMYQRVFFGPVTSDENRTLTDLNAREVFVVSALVVGILWIGIYPQPFLRRIEPTATAFLQHLEQRGATRYLEPGPGSWQARVD